MVYVYNRNVNHELRTKFLVYFEGKILMLGARGPYRAKYRKNERN